jgi:hypothetical protein
MICKKSYAMIDGILEEIQLFGVPNLKTSLLLFLEIRLMDLIWNLSYSAM